jgi:hypothetical protein
MPLKQMDGIKARSTISKELSQGELRYSSQNRVAKQFNQSDVDTGHGSNIHTASGRQIIKTKATARGPEINPLI